MKRLLLSLFLVLFFVPRLFAQVPSAAGVLYVVKGATGNGSSWANAMGELGDALAAARSLNATPSTVREIWVAQGTYYPTEYIDIANPLTRSRTFRLLPNVSVYGGFAGNETAISQRNIPANRSILDGDIGTINNSADNVLHVVTCLNVSGFELNGFDIVNGNANNAGAQIVEAVSLGTNYGGGIYATYANGSLKNLRLMNNIASSYGGGMLLYISSSLVVEDCEFANNLALNGGGMVYYNTIPSILNRLTFTNNKATSTGGGAAVLFGTATFANTIFKGNTATSLGGGITTSNSGALVITNSLISGNAAGTSGGAISGTAASCTIRNTTISSNYNGNANANSINLTQPIDLYNSIVYRNTRNAFIGSNVYNNYVESLSTPVNGNIDGSLDPQLISAPLPVAGGTTSGDFRLKANSPLIDAGLNSYFTGLGAATLDLQGNPRVTDYATSGVIDMGAFEFGVPVAQTITAPANLIFVYGTADPLLTATASSNLTVEYTSSDNAIAEPYQDAAAGNAWKLRIKAVGAVAITAKQPGDATFAPATDVIIPVTVTKPILTVTVTDAVFSYNATPYSGGNGYTVTGFVNGDDESVISGTPVYGGAAQGATNVGNYVLTLGGLTATNYDITFVDGRARILPASLNIVADDDFKSYDGFPYTIASNHNVTYTGFVGTDNETNALTGSLSFTGDAQNAVNAGTYSITPTGLTSPNYFINYVPGTLTVNKSLLVIKARTEITNYTGAAYVNTAGVTYTGFMNTDTETSLGGTLTYGGTSLGAINAGTYVIMPTGYTSTNYDIFYQSGTLIISKVNLTVKANDYTKMYDQVPYTGGNGVVITGFLGTDNVSSLGGTLTYGSTSQNAVDVGLYDIRPSGYTSLNYNFVYQVGQLQITRAPLLITANPATQAYTGTAYNGGNGVTYSGFVGTDNVTNLTGTLAYGGSSQGAINVGNYNITPGGYSTNNYTITYVAGTLTIQPTQLDIYVDNIVKPYDGLPVNTFTSTITGFVNGENISVLTGSLTYTGTGVNAVNAGNYLVTLSGLSSPNYNIVYHSGTVNIQQVNLIITANDHSQTYNGVAYTGDNGYTYAGFVNSETVAALTGTLSMTGTSQGAINTGTYTLAPTGVSSTNYVINFVPGTLTITPATLVVTATNATKVYDGLTYTGGNGATYMGFVAGENEAVLSGTLAYIGTSQGAVNAGNYIITPSGYTSTNYNIIYLNGTLNIAKASLIVTADNANKSYNGQIYTGFTATYVGFQNGETTANLSGSLSFTGSATTAVNVGTYGIVPGGFTAANYDFTYTSGLFVIDPVNLIVTATDLTKSYDGIAYTGGNGVTYSGFVGSEDATVLGGTLTYSGTSQGAVNTGNYVITPSGLTSTNYTINFVNGALNIGQSILTVTAVNDTKTYNGIAYNGGNNVTYAGFVNGENATVLSGTLTYSGTSQGATNAGTYTILPSGLTSTNYTIQYNTGTLTITPASLTVTASNDTKVYDGVTYNGGNGVTYAGFVGTEDETVLGGTLVYNGTSQGAINAGNYIITPSGYTSTNYNITYSNGTLDITKAGLSITADNVSKNYNGQVYTSFTANYTGFQNGETAANLTGSLSFTGNATTAVNVGTYTVTPSGYTSTNYDITYNNGSLVISPVNLMVTATDVTKTYDGIAFVGGNGATYTGFVNGEDPTVLSGTLAFNGNSQGAINTGSYNITPSGFTSPNYMFTYVAGTLTITPASLTVTAIDDTKTYNGIAYNGGNGATYTGFVNGENATVLGGTLTYSGTSQGATNTGNYLITPGGLTSPNYTINFNNGTLQITPATLTITATNATKVYDGIAYNGGNGVTYAGFVGTEDETVLGGTLVYMGTSQGAVNAGNYIITPSGYTSSNYNITYTNGTLDISKAGLSITADNASKNYDGQVYTGFTANYTGFQNGETAANLTGSLSFTGNATTAVNVGTYTVTPSGYTSTNYDITYNNGSLVISPVNLTVTATDATKSYDGIAYTGGNGVTYTGFVNGEDASVLAGTLAYTGTSQGAINTGNYNITPSGFSSSNYMLTYVTGTLTINPASLTVTAIDDTKTYNGIAYNGGNGVTYTGFVNGENATVLGGTLTYSGTSQGATNTGNYLITPGGLTSPNYTINFNNGTLQITTATLTITATNATKVYDGIAYNGGNGVTYAGFVGTEDETVLGGTLVYMGTSQGAVNAGNYIITPSGYTSSNYNITYTNGTLDITKAGLIITADNASKNYDGQVYTGFTANYTGFQNGETAANLIGSLSFTGNATTAVNVGTYTVTPSGYTSTNYDITYNNGSLVIDPVSLTVTATDVTKTYDGIGFVGGNGVTYTGFVNGEDATVLSGTLSYTGNSQGAINTGNYNITPSGFSSSNYMLTYVTGTLTINPASLTVTAIDDTKTYNGIAYNGGNGVTYTGFVNGENATVLGGTLTYSGTSQGATNTGNYLITPGGLTSPNYTINFNNGTLQITTATLTITATNATKVYDGIAYNGGNGVTYAGFVGTEDETILGGTLVYMGTSQGAVNAGNYIITPSGYTSSNYNITYTNGTLDITKAGLSITADNASKNYDGQLYTGFTANYTGFQNGETAANLTGSLSFTGNATTAVNAGTYTVTPSGYTSTNYDITYNNGTLVIDPVGLTVTATDATKTYDGIAYAGGNGVTYTGFVGSEDATVLGGTLSYTGTSQGAINTGNYVITPSGFTSSNYIITYTNGALTINPATLNVTAVDDNKAYDGIAYNGGNGATYTGFVNGEGVAILSGTLAYNGTSQGAQHVGNYTIIPSGLTAANYTINYINGNLQITPATLTITANNDTKNYDGVAYNGGNGVTYNGFVNGETASVLTGTMAYLGTSQGAITPGTYTITPSGITAQDYTISFIPGQLVIDKGTLTITANNAQKTYNAIAYNGGNGVTYTGFVNGDNAGTLSGTITYSGTSQGAINAGNYMITPSGVTSAYYNIVFTNGTLTINRAPLTITAEDKQRCVGSANPTFTFSFSGFVANESLSVLTSMPTATSSATAASTPGNYTIVPAGAQANNYTITYVNGNLTVIASPVSTMTAPQGQLLCGPTASVQLQASGNYTFTWYLNNAQLPNTNGTLQVMNEGTYTAIATNANGCAATVANSITITKRLAPTANFVFDSYCMDKPVTFINQSNVANSGPVTYTWSSSEGQSSSAASPRFTYPIPGIFHVTLTVTPNECPALATTTSKSVAIEMAIPAQRLKQASVVANMPGMIKGRQFPLANYNWSPMVGLSSTTVFNPFATLTQSQEYTIEMQFPSGCVTTDTLFVDATAKSTFYVASAFTPNNDGKNDLLHVVPKGVKQLTFFKVFDRWGNVVFETRDAAHGWDGTFKSLEVPTGAYIWFAEGVGSEGQVIQAKGNVTLIR